MKKKMKIIAVLILAIAVATPVVMATSWVLSHNTGNEPFRTTSVMNNTGSHTVGTSLTTPIVITNTGTSTINFETGDEGDASIDISLWNLTKGGESYTTATMIAGVAYYWLRFPQNPVTNHRGWINMTCEMYTSTYHFESLTNSVIQGYGTWVDGGGSPTEDFVLQNGHTMELRVFYTIDTDDCDEDDYSSPASGFKPADAGVRYRIVYYE